MYSYSQDKIAEKEANEFAAALLMPPTYFEKDIKRFELSMNSIEKLAEKYDTSLLSTALNFIKKCDDPGAVVFSANGKIKWTFSSHTFPNIIKDSGDLDEFSCAYNFFNKGQALYGTPQKVLSEVWSKRILKHDYFIEETISMPHLNSTLSIIKPFIEDDEEALEYYEY